MHRKKIDVDIVKDILTAASEAYPESTFIQSLAHQYEERGGLSKKQLEGLFKKAQKIKGLPAGKLATLEAEILHRPTRYRSKLPENKPLYSKEEKTGEMIEAILAKYPHHKRVLYFKSKYDLDEPLSAAEILELERFAKLLK